MAKKMSIATTYTQYKSVYPVQDTVCDLNVYITYMIYAWYRCMAFAQEKVPQLPTLTLRIGCPLIEDNRTKDRDIRAMGHTLHFKNTVCIHPALALCPINFIYGILIHELGHNIDHKLKIVHDHDDQYRADVTVFDKLGITIRYDNPWKVEWIDNRDIKAIMR